MPCGIPRRLFCVLILPLFYPYIGFIDGIDTQPFFLLPLLVLLALCGVSGGAVRRTDAIAVAVLVCLAMIGGLFHFPEGWPRVPFFYVAALMVWLSFSYLSSAAVLVVLSPTFIAMVSLTYIFVGLLQLLFENSFAAGFVSRPVEQVTQLVESGRGVRSLTPEPSQLARLLLQLNLLFVAYGTLVARHRLAIRSLVVGSALLLFASVFVAQSLYGATVHLTCFLVLLMVLRQWIILLLSVCTIPIAVLLAIWLVDVIGDVRFLYLMQLLAAEPAQIFEFGAIRRLLNIPLSIAGGFQHGCLGAEAGAEAVAIEVSDDRHILVGSKLFGGVFEHVLVFGVFGVPAVVYFSRVVWKISKLHAPIAHFGERRIGWYFALGVFAVFFQYGSLLDPIAYLLVAFLYNLATVQSRYARSLIYWK